MRAHEIKHFDSVLQALSEPGCPLCVFLKNVQTRLVQEGQSSDFIRLCNAHAWAVAAVRETRTAAQIFLSLLEGRSSIDTHECSICLRLAQEEILRTRELLASLERRSVLEWITKQGIICFPHGRRLRSEASAPALALIEQLLDRTALELETELRQLLREASRSGSQQSGLLGRAAEYLVAQRGISLTRAAGSEEGRYSNS